jgi:hypothetical protein
LKNVQVNTYHRDEGEWGEGGKLLILWLKQQQRFGLLLIPESDAVLAVGIVFRELEAAPRSERASGGSESFALFLKIEVSSDVEK